LTRAPLVRWATASAFAVVCLLGARCGTPSEEARIKELLKDSVARAEKKDVGALAKFFAPDYVDFEGRDTETTVDLVKEYLARYRGVVVHLLGARVESIDPEGQAAVECEVSLSHGAAEVLRKLIRYTGEYYHFRLELRKAEGGEWRYTYAEWRSIDLTDLFPESLAVLKKLFPEL
jgi:hypothetical protein